MTSLTLASLTSGDVYLMAQNISFNWANTSANNWAIWYRKLDSKTLGIGADAGANFTAPLMSFFSNNYAISLNIDNETGIPQIRVYQVSLTDGAAVPRFALTSNINQSFIPSLVSLTMIKHTVYVFFKFDDQKINVANFKVGSVSPGPLQFTVTDSDTSSSLSVVWGESLGSKQLFATWVENGVLKNSIIDVTRGTVAPIALGGYYKNCSCQAYATDGKWYGTLCWNCNALKGTTNLFIRTNTTSLVPFAHYYMNNSS